MFLRDRNHCGSAFRHVCNEDVPLTKTLCALKTRVKCVCVSKRYAYVDLCSRCLHLRCNCHCRYFATQGVEGYRLDLGSSVLTASVLLCKSCVVAQGQRVDWGEGGGGNFRTADCVGGGGKGGGGGVRASASSAELVSCWCFTPGQPYGYPKAMPRERKTVASITAHSYQ